MKFIFKSVSSMNLKGYLNKVFYLLTLFLLVFTLSSCDEALSESEQKTEVEEAPPVNKAALSVSLVSPEEKTLTDRLTASGNIFPWQIVDIAAEITGVRVVEVLAAVGDVVEKGQLLARLDDTNIKIELAFSRATLAEAEANFAQSKLSLKRARRLAESKAISEEELLEQETLTKINEAKVAQANAQVRTQKLRLSFTKIIAPDDGVIASSDASVGALSETIGNMYRLIRKNRIEWRAELRPEEVGKIEIGQKVELLDPAGDILIGTVRQIAPTVDFDARTSLVYVDVEPNKVLKPGVFTTGDFMLSERTVLTLPYTSVVFRDGFSYVMKVDESGVVEPVKINLKSRRGDIVEVLGGVQIDDKVVAKGGAFLYAGDRVRVVDSAPGLINAEANSTE